MNTREFIEQKISKKAKTENELIEIFQLKANLETQNLLID